MCSFYCCFPLFVSATSWLVCLALCLNVPEVDVHPPLNNLEVGIGGVAEQCPPVPRLALSYALSQTGITERVCGVIIARDGWCGDRRGGVGEGMGEKVRR